MPLKNECVAQVTAKITGINESNAQKRDSLKVKIEKIYTDVAPPKDIADILINISKDIDAKDSKSGVRDDIVSPTEKYSSYLLILIPVLALIAIVSIVLIRKMKK